MKSTLKRKCRRHPHYSLTHKGNTWTRIKYAIQCENIKELQETKRIFQKIGFRVAEEENDTFHHTFLYPPAFIGKHFMIILSLGKHIFRKKFHVGDARVGTHLGFKVTPEKRRQMERLLCNEKIMIVDKPDEISLFIQLPCGEIIEFSG